MIKIKIVTPDSVKVVESSGGASLLEILRKEKSKVYSPCGGKGTCGKCLVNVKDEGEVISCRYYPEKDIEVILPGEEEANILVHQTEYLEDVPFIRGEGKYHSDNPLGIAIDIGTTTVVLYFLNMNTGQIEKVSSFLNPQKAYGADVISRIGYCQENENGLNELQHSIVDAINSEIKSFTARYNFFTENIEKVVVVGNTTMLHLLLGEDPVSIALAPFTPKFTDKQVRPALSIGLNVNKDTFVETLPCISAYVGADILAGLAALNVADRNYLLLDIGTNGEIALIKGEKIFTCATAAGPAFEGANLSCGMGAVTGAVAAFATPEHYNVIGNTDPSGVCGSGVVDIIAYLLDTGMIDETGLLKETFFIGSGKKVKIEQQDIREIQLAKSAIYSGVKILLNESGLSFSDVDALYLAGGFGNYINIKSAIKIGLLPFEMRDKVFAVGNSAGIGAFQYLKSNVFAEKSDKILKNTSYIELSDIDDFTMEFALNMDFTKPGLL